MFDEFVIDAVSEGNTEFAYETCEEAQRLLTQFNSEIESVIDRYGVDAAGTAIWYTYGCGSGMIHDVLDETVSEGVDEFYLSVQSLYENGFARHCQHTPEHRRCCGKFDTACYMLWDMGGIELLTFQRSVQQLQLAEPLIDFGLSHNHPAVQTSFLHCLGHQRDEHPEFVDHRIASFLQRRDLAAEIREYALECLTGMIL